MITEVGDRFRKEAVRNCGENTGIYIGVNQLDGLKNSDCTGGVAVTVG